MDLRALAKKRGKEKIPPPQPPPQKRKKKTAASRLSFEPPRYCAFSSAVYKFEDRGRRKPHACIGPAAEDGQRPYNPHAREKGGASRSGSMG